MDRELEVVFEVRESEGVQLRLAAQLSLPDTLGLVQQHFPSSAVVSACLVQAPVP